MSIFTRNGSVCCKIYCSPELDVQIRSINLAGLLQLKPVYKHSIIISSYLLFRVGFTPNSMSLCGGLAPRYRSRITTSCFSGYYGPIAHLTEGLSDLRPRFTDTVRNASSQPGQLLMAVSQSIFSNQGMIRVLH